MAEASCKCGHRLLRHERQFTAPYGSLDGRYFSYCRDCACDSWEPAP